MTERLAGLFMPLGFPAVSINLNGRYAIKSSIKRRIELKHVLYELRLSYAKPVDVGSIKNSKSDKTDKWLMGIESPVMAFRESRSKQILRYLGYVPAIMSIN
uniref:Uncharacterized protein n=1 Tax=Glossina palpalis gambiensis TaxID=67801 RepID=A0A1B0B757_9MUSC